MARMCREGIEIVIQVRLCATERRDRQLKSLAENQWVRPQAQNDRRRQVARYLCFEREHGLIIT